MIGEIIFWIFCLVGVLFLGSWLMPDETLEVSEHTLDRINGNKH